MAIPRRIIFGILAVALSASGCWDREVELRLLADGSGFMTTWIRVDARDARVAAALSGSSVEQEINLATANIRAATEKTEGVDYLDETVSEEAGQIALRFRILFDRVSTLNAFWASEEAQAIPILLSGGKLQQVSGGGLCGPHRVELAFDKRNPEAAVVFDDQAIARLDPQTRRLFNEKVLSGRFRLRVIPPGRMDGSDAPTMDADGDPIYDTTQWNLFENGLTARVRSHVVCGEDSRPNPEPKTVTVGPTPEPAEIASVLASLPALVETKVVFTQRGRDKADVALTIEAKKPVDEALATYLPILVGALPGAAADMSMVVEDHGDRVLFRFQSQKPFDFKEHTSHLVFFGRDGGIDVFRMLLPTSPYGARRGEGDLEHRVVTVTVNFDDKIDKTNATQRTDKSATWVITDKMMKNPVTLEAISYKGLFKR